MYLSIGVVGLGINLKLDPMVVDLATRITEEGVSMPEEGSKAISGRIMTSVGLIVNNAQEKTMLAIDVALIKAPAVFEMATSVSETNSSLPMYLVNREEYSLGSNSRLGSIQNLTSASFRVSLTSNMALKLI